MRQWNSREYEEQIKQVVLARDQLMALLCTIIKHPEALEVNDDGSVSIAASAVGPLQTGTRLRISKAPGRIGLAVDIDDTRIVKPTIIV